MQKYEPIGLKTMDGKEIMTYTKEYYLHMLNQDLKKHRKYTNKCL